jgi:DNA-binding MarR family transcriptional regulator
MNAHDEKAPDSYRSYLLMTEITREEPLSQRELARRLGIAVGLVNSYLKNLVAKGYVRIKAFPKNRYSYLLTPQGIAEKSRLAYQHLSYFTDLYTVARQDYLELFRRLEASGIRQVAFCGVDEVAEIAYLSLKETGLELVAVLDEEKEGSDFFGSPILSLMEGVRLKGAPLVITSRKRHPVLNEALLKMGVAAKMIFVAGETGSVGR